jgi:hypothetical protein
MPAPAGAAPSGFAIGITPIVDGATTGRLSKSQKKILQKEASEAWQDYKNFEAGILHDPDLDGIEWSDHPIDSDCSSAELCNKNITRKYKKLDVEKIWSMKSPNNDPAPVIAELKAYREAAKEASRQLR